MALMTDSLQRFEALQSDDDLKRDLELTCTECGEVLCDIQDGDNLKLLAEIADDHTCSEETEETEHAYAEYDTPEILRDHLVEHHDFLPASTRVLFEAGGHHLRTSHRMAHHQDPEGD